MALLDWSCRLINRIFWRRTSEIFLNYEEMQDDLSQVGRVGEVEVVKMGIIYRIPCLNKKNSLCLMPRDDVHPVAI